MANRLIILLLFALLPAGVWAQPAPVANTLSAPGSDANPNADAIPPGNALPPAHASPKATLERASPGRDALPQLRDPVEDLAGALSSSTIATLRQQAFDLRQRKGAQLQVLVIESTGKDSIESYAQAVFEQWQLGRSGVDDGVLLLVAVADRRVRIETGYGLEGAIPDAYAARIINGSIVPRFRDGDIDQGVLDGAAALTALIDGEALPAPREDNVLPAHWQWGDSVVLLTMALAFGVGLHGRPWFGRAVVAAPARLQPKKRHGKGRVPAPKPVVAPQTLFGRTLPRRWKWLATPLVGLAGLVMLGVLYPRYTVPFAFMLATLLPISFILGWSWRRSAWLRGVLYAMAGLSAVYLVVMLVRGAPPPALARHFALNIAAGVVFMLGFFQAMALRARWRKGRVGFFVRFTLLAAVSIAYAMLVADLLRRGEDVVIIVLVIGLMVLYVGWLLLMIPATAVSRGVGGSGPLRYRAGRSSSSGSSGSSSSRSSSWSGGGGRSGGGGASGSW